MAWGNRRTKIVAACLAIVLAVGFGFVWLDRPVEQTLGITFSSRYAGSLGLDPQAAFAAMLDELGARQIRIPAYWPDIEPVNGEYRWDELDGLMRAAEAHGAEVTLVIGAKVPRWPECHIPDWAASADSFDREELKQFMVAVIERYRNSPSLARWQVENEPYFDFGECPEPDPRAVDEEIALVRLHDDHPVAMTVSGELELWLPSAVPADVLGVSVYRVTWNETIGYFRYPIPPLLYRVRAFFLRPFVDETYVSELQAEPWLSEPLEKRTPAEWAKAFTPEELRENVEYAARTGLPRADLWGAEWWYWLKVNGEPGLWDEATRLFHED